MGLTISWNEADPIPRVTTLTLVCDAETSGAAFRDMFVANRAEFNLSGGFVENYSAAMKAGWLERHDKTRGRIFLCPDCSGKRIS